MSRENIGKRVWWAGHVWTIVGVNYPGDYDIERFEQRSGSLWRVGGNCELGLPESHPRYAVLLETEQEERDA